MHHFSLKQSNAFIYNNHWAVYLTHTTKIKIIQFKIRQKQNRNWLSNWLNSRSRKSHEDSLRGRLWIIQVYFTFRSWNDYFIRCIQKWLYIWYIPPSHEIIKKLNKHIFHPHYLFLGRNIKYFIFIVHFNFDTKSFFHEILSAVQIPTHSFFEFLKYKITINLTQYDWQKCNALVRIFNKNKFEHWIENANNQFINNHDSKQNKQW